MQQIVSIPSLAGGNDDDLTTEECLWFIELRTIALESGLIQEGEFTNFEYAQYALIVNGNVSQGISRMTKVCFSEALEATIQILNCLFRLLTT